jgi:hypothetical protein
VERLKKGTREKREAGNVQGERRTGKCVGVETETPTHFFANRFHDERLEVFPVTDEVAGVGE